MQKKEKRKNVFPVPSGQVTERFGRQPHPVFKGITIENNGIKVVVPNGTRARCVFPGVVSNILVSGGAKLYWLNMETTSVSMETWTM